MFALITKRVERPLYSFVKSRHVQINQDGHHCTHGNISPRPFLLSIEMVCIVQIHVQYSYELLCASLHDLFYDSGNWYFTWIKPTERSILSSKAGGQLKTFRKIRPTAETFILNTVSQGFPPPPGIWPSPGARSLVIWPSLGEIPRDIAPL